MDVCSTCGFDNWFGLLKGYVLFCLLHTTKGDYGYEETCFGY